MASKTYRAITLTQPWATLIALGAKRIETRDWPFDWKGPLAIHAAKGWTKDDRELCADSPFREALALGGFTSPEQLPRGQVVCVSELLACARIPGTIDTMPERYWARFQEHPPELQFGNYEPGRWAWLLGPPDTTGFPVEAKGKQGIWFWRPDVERVLEP